MIVLKATKKRSISTCLAAAVLLLIAHTAFGQIRIGRIKITKPNIVNSKGEKPQPQPENTSLPSDAGKKPAAGSESSATAAVQNDPPGLLNYFLSEIAEAKKDVDIYDPATRLYLVKAVQEEWVLRAVSARARAEHAATVKYTEWRRANPGNELDAALDDLAKSVAKKLPIYKPGVSAFQFHNPVAEKLLMGSFTNTATMKIHRLGVGSAGWMIQKDSDGLPSYRYKFANVYFRDTSDDHPYCHRVSVRVKQDYAGGGTYSTEIYRSSADDELFACP
ncbi:MAG: hypothetical protein JWM21_2199 [Acidobacteria bacterium]|nr:hypothetical protein [Acidobacteriota bacterium]